MRFRGWTEIVEYDPSTASGLVECEPCKDENCLYRLSASETAGTRYQEWLGWYLGNIDSLLCKMGGQFWWQVYVERGWTMPVDEVTL